MQDLVPNLKKVRKGLSFIYYPFVVLILSLFLAGISIATTATHSPVPSFIFGAATLLLGTWIVGILIVVGKILCLDTPVAKNVIMGSVLIDCALLLMGGDRFSFVGVLLACVSFGLFLFFLYQLAIFQDSEHTRTLLGRTIVSGCVTFTAILLVFPVFLIVPDALRISMLVVLALVIYTLFTYLQVLSTSRRALARSIESAAAGDFLPNAVLIPPSED